MILGAMIDEPANYVFLTPEGGWRLTGTRISLDSIVHAYWDGQAPEAVAVEFPSLTLEQIHGAIAFYLRNRDEIDRYLADQRVRWEQLRRQSEAQNGILRERLRQRARTAGGFAAQPERRRA